jgi:hypothetical protein
MWREAIQLASLLHAEAVRLLERAVMLTTPVWPANEEFVNFPSSGGLNAYSSYSYSAANLVQGGLAIVGLVPGIGTIANGANVAISLYRGNYLDAALYGAAMVPFAGALADIGEIGEIGETAAGIIKNTKRIESLTRTAAYRIPDELNDAERIISEVTNVRYQSYTRQLRDSVLYAQKYGYKFRLYVRQGAKLSAPLRDALEPFGGPIEF